METAPPIRDTRTDQCYLAPENLENAVHEPQQRARFIGRTALYSPKLETPVDSLTGIPLPVYPNWRRLNPKSANNNWHHHYHKSTDPALTSQDGLAIRHSRLQLLPIPVHNRYHDIFEGPPLPKTNSERFGHLVLVSAGYIPSEAVNVYGDNPAEVVELSDKKRSRLQSSGQIHLRGQSNISNFMRRYLIKQDLSHVDEQLIDEFLHTGSIYRKRFLGHYLLAMASEVAVEPIKPVYQQALEEGLIVEQDRKLPNLVKAYINGPKTADKTIRGLHKALNKRYTGTGLPNPA